MEIFKILGTPTEKNWPGLSKLKHYNCEIPQFKASGLKDICKGFLKDDGVDLMKKMLILDPLKRISAKKAMDHCYFKDLFKKNK